MVTDDEIYDRMWFLAIHEAAHYVAERHEGRRPKYVTIVPNEEMGAAGHMMPGGVSTGSRDGDKIRLTTRTVISHLFTLMAGPIAQNMIVNEFVNPLGAVKNSRTDFEDITHYLNSVESLRGNKRTKEIRQELFDKALKKTTRWLEKSQAMADIHFVAILLIEKEHLTSTELDKIL